jgi:hypothetical protein
MKIISKVGTSLLLTVIVTACNGLPPTTLTSPTDVMGTATSAVNTEVVMTQIAIPVDTSLTPTTVPPDAYSAGQASPPPADKLDHAMVTAPKVYNLLPYINEATPYGEYSGCTETNDFHNFVSYYVELSMETVNVAFVGYFQTENWDFAEAIPGDNTTTITYDVYRIASNDIPAFERLRVILTDQSIAYGKNHINVRAELTHVETKENLSYLVDPLTCYNNQAWWLWIRLTK